MTKIANNPVIPVRLQLDADPYDLKQMIEEAVRESIRDIRVR
jgi:antitoxin component of RelBE/YafQ-DinJ toxin-antitoxin module